MKLSSRGFTLIELLMVALGSSLVLIGSAEVINTYLRRTIQMSRAADSFNSLKDSVEILRRDLKMGNLVTLVNSYTLSIQVNCLAPSAGTLITTEIEYKIEPNKLDPPSAPNTRFCFDTVGNRFQCYMLTRTAYKGQPFQMVSRIHDLIKINWWIDATPAPGLGPAMMPAVPELVMTPQAVGPTPDTNLANKRFGAVFSFLPSSANLETLNNAPAVNGVTSLKSTTRELEIFFAVDLENQSVSPGLAKPITTLCNIGGG